MELQGSTKFVEWSCIFGSGVLPNSLLVEFTGNLELLAGDFQISFPLQQEETLKHTVRGGLLIFPQNKIHGQEEPRVVLYAYSHFPEHVDRFLEYQICQILCALEFVL